MSRLNLDDNDDLLRLYNRPLLEKRAIQQLHGMAAAWIYDGVVENHEVAHAVEWLDPNLEFRARPASTCRGPARTAAHIGS